jgi:predicted secreted acid phosphatase
LLARVRTRYLVRLFGAIVALACCGCTTATREPPNLYPHKQQIRAYVESGQYLSDITKVATTATQWLETRAPRGGSRLTMVCDLDDTLFSNWPLISAMDFGYVRAEWDRWVAAANAPVLEPVREVYRAARRLGVEVIFITGRREGERSSTERNLRAIDCAEYAALFCMSPTDHGTTAAFKRSVRRQLTMEGKTIIANIGDQESDLSGGFAERVFKLPNAFYVTE